MARRSPKRNRERTVEDEEQADVNESEQSQQSERGEEAVVMYVASPEEPIVQDDANIVQTLSATDSEGKKLLINERAEPNSKFAFVYLTMKRFPARNKYMKAAAQ